MTILIIDKDRIPPADAILAMSDDEAEAAFLRLRWADTGGSPVCPRCDCQRVYSCFPRSNYKCADCLCNFSATSGTPFSGRKMRLKGYLLAISLFSRGANAHQVSQEMELQYASAYRLAHILKDMGIDTQVGRRHKPIYLKCEECGATFRDVKGEKTSSLRRGKHKHAFCTSECYGAFKSKGREDERCKRCKKSRRDLSPFKAIAATGVSFCHGYCQRCYGLLKAYNWDEALCQTHEMTQQLKKEPTNDIERKNTADLRNLLLEAIEGVRKGKVDHRQAQAISALSSRILQSARLDFDVMKLAMLDQTKPAPKAVSLTGDTVKLVAGKTAPVRKKVS